MCEKLSERKERASKPPEEGRKKATVSDEALFKQAGIKVKKG